MQLEGYDEQHQAHRELGEHGVECDREGELDTVPQQGVAHAGPPFVSGVMPTGRERPDATSGADGAEVRGAPSSLFGRRGAVPALLAPSIRRADRAPVK